MNPLTMSSLAALAAASVSLPSAAQPPAPTTMQTTTEADGAIPDIIVQARRRDEGLQSVPLAITALSGDALRSQSVVTVQDLGQHIPSLTVSGNLGRRDTVVIGIRGQRNLLPRLSYDAAVGVYFAEVPIARPYGLNASLYDISSVQVLKGPQGTLFGRNTTGGAMLFEPNRPTDDFGGSVELEYGNYDHRMVTGMFNLPVSDTLAVRVAGRIAKRDGFTKNILTGKRLDAVDNQSFRASVKFNPTPDIENLLVYDFYHSSTSGQSVYLRALRPGGVVSRLFGPGGTFGDIASELAAQKERGPHRVALDGVGPSKVRNQGISNRTTITLSDDISLKNVLGWRKVKSQDTTDLDGSPLPISRPFQTANIQQLSEELQLQGKALDGALSYIVGGFYFREWGDDITYGTSLNIPIPLGPGAPINTLTNPRSSGGYGRSESESLFAQLTYEIPGVAGLKATAGFRYSWDKRRVEISPADSLGCRFERTAATPAGLTPCLAIGRASFSAPTWTVGLDYQVSPKTLLYIVSRRGYRSGGLNIGSESFAELKPFLPETVTDVETGIKSDWLLGSVPVRTNAAFYYSSGKDVQRTAQIIPERVTTTTLNAASTEIYGAELEVIVRPTSGLSLSGYFSWDHARYKKFVTVSGDFSNNRFSFTPEVKYGLTVRYETELPSIGEAAATFDYSWQGRVEFGDINEVESYQSSYGLANARLELNKAGGSPADIALFVRNIFKKEYANSGTAFQNALGFTSILPGEPRMYGVQVRYSF